MRIFRTSEGIFAQQDGEVCFYSLQTSCSENVDDDNDNGGGGGNNSGDDHNDHNDGDNDKTATNRT